MHVPILSKHYLNAIYAVLFADVMTVLSLKERDEKRIVEKQVVLSAIFLGPFSYAVRINGGEN